MAEILALGDCNMLGVGSLEHHSYPEEFAKKINKSVKNCGYTMSTTREMVHFFNAFKSDSTEIILIQYGLVDSWQTFKYSPYVLYYPDNKFRKIFRKMVKKYKKICKRLGLNSLFGTKNVVEPNEYKDNLQYVIQNSSNCLIFLIDTIPNQDVSRNTEIVKYNNIMQEISNEYSNVYKINLYNLFENKNELYLDATHLNSQGITLVAQIIYDKYKSLTEVK